MMAGISREIVSRRAIGRMTAKDTSVFAWAYGMLGLRPSRVIRCLTREGLATIQDATPHDLSNLAWGLARAGMGGGSSEEAEEEEEGDEAEGHPSTSTSTPGSLSGNEPAEARSGLGGSGGREGGRPTKEAGHEQGEEQREEAAAARAEGSGATGGGSDSVDGVVHGPWGLGWMKGKRPIWRRHPHDEEEEEGGEEDDDERGEHGGSGVTDPAVDGGLERGGSRATGIAGDVNTAAADVTPGADRTDHAQSRDTSDGSVEQRLGEALLARADGSFRQFQPKQLSRLCWALGAWHQRGVVLLPGSGPFVTRALSEAGKHPKDYTAEELAQVLCCWPCCGDHRTLFNGKLFN
ncbi:unnamed protein product [Scytosiphon promiscuus]